jgi:hypothetical protein
VISRLSVAPFIHISAHPAAADVSDRRHPDHAMIVIVMRGYGHALRSREQAVDLSCVRSSVTETAAGLQNLRRYSHNGGSGCAAIKTGPRADHKRKAGQRGDAGAGSRPQAAQYCKTCQAHQEVTQKNSPTCIKYGLLCWKQSGSPGRS